MFGANKIEVYNYTYKEAIELCNKHGDECFGVVEENTNNIDIILKTLSSTVIQIVLKFLIYQVLVLNLLRGVFYTNV